MTDRQPILIVGMPRSGTTWIGEVLASARRINYVFEPDNEALSPIAWVCKRDMHRFPYLTSRDVAPEYQRLWDTIVAGNVLSWYANVALGLSVRRLFRRKAELEAHMGIKCGLQYIDEHMHWVGHAAQARPFHVEQHPLVAFMARQFLTTSRTRQPRLRTIIKSVHSPLSTEWIASIFAVKVLIALRNPHSLYASYKRMRLPDGYRNLLSQPTLQRDWSLFAPEPSKTLMRNPEDSMALQIMSMYKIIQIQSSQRHDWALISHDRLCITPYEHYHRIFQELDLTWSRTTDQKIDSLNRPGTGFNPQRVTKDQPNKWKAELSEADRSAIERWTDAFELRDFFCEHIDLN